MKGRLLSFEEVHNLKEGTKVWHYNDKIQVHEIRKVSRSIAIIENKDILYLVSNTCGCVINTLESYNNLGCKTYEHIDDSKILTGDKIKNLEDGTKVNFIDKCIYKNNIGEGIINQYNKIIKYYSIGAKGSSYYIDFQDLEEYEVKAWVIEEPKQENIEIHKEVKLYNLVEMVEEMKSTGCLFKDLESDSGYSLICGELKCINNNKIQDICDYSQEFLLKKFIKIENKPVDFITAIKTYDKGVPIYVEYNNIVVHYDFTNKNSASILSAVDTNAILNGKWFIK